MFIIERNVRVRLLVFLTLLTLVVSYFGIGGVNAQTLKWTAVSNPSTSIDEALGVAVASTGVYVVGFDMVLGFPNARWRIERRSPATGALLVPPVISDPSTSDEWPYGVAVDGTGVYVVGYDRVGGDARWRIEKRNLTSLARMWTKVTDPSTGDDVAVDVAVASTGVYVVGVDMVGGDARWRIERRSPTTGALLAPPAISDPSAGQDVPYGVAVDGTGVYVVGLDLVGGDARWRIEKRNLTSLAPMWTKVTDPSTGIDAASDVAVASTGVYVVGFDMVLQFPNARWRIERRSPTTGALLAAPVISDPSAGDDMPYGVAVDGTGVYVVGYDRVGGDPRWRIEKRNLTSLAPMWTKVTDPSTSDDGALDVAVDSTGIYTVGCDYVPGNPRWRMEKRTP